MNSLTVCAPTGTKAQLFRRLLGPATSGTDESVPAMEWRSLQRIEASTDAEEKLASYATAVTAIHTRLAPLFLVLQQAGPSEPSLAEPWTQIATGAGATLAPAPLRAVSPVQLLK
ncbi:MAG: hypothetical protein KDC39_03325 [Actinobacteria bacterium]|nr:hypothetical protein [Actinomycetota bacterium]